MTELKRFKDMNVEVVETNSFIGDKIKISKVLNREIAVYGFNIKNSKFPDIGNGKCLYLQIELNGEKRILFTGSVVLQERIKKVNEVDFPFLATIVKDNERYDFT